MTVTGLSIWTHLALVGAGIDFFHRVRRGRECFSNAPIPNVRSAARSHLRKKFCFTPIHGVGTAHAESLASLCAVWLRCRESPGSQTLLRLHLMRLARR